MARHVAAARRERREASLRIAARITRPAATRATAALALVLVVTPGEVHDLVIAHGRVMDPASGFDAVAWAGISGGVVKAISLEPLAGRDTIDASGLVVSPGFIDILSYNPDPVGAWNKVADGVTTALAMHGGTAGPDAWYARYERQRPPLNFGASFFHTEARNQLGIGRYQRATAAKIRQLTTMADRALRQGALGVSLSPEYVPGTTREEMLPLMQLARQYQVPVFFHARYSDMEEPGTNLEALQEIIDLARQSGAAVHIEHLTSTGGTFSMAESLALLDEARSGLDITACAYPYDFWATYLNSARFDPGWQSRFRISYDDLQIAGTRERLTAEGFHKYRKAGTLAVAYAIPEDDVTMALQSPWVMIGSDAVLEPGYNNHPRASGTFARTLGRYVRERPVLSLMEALAKMTILPARRLEQRSEAMRRKGRLSVGADADITIFDPATVTDQATVEHPEYPSEGIHYVLVNGVVVKDPSGLHRTRRPGRAIRNSGVPESLARR
jgi:dihydroorotase